MKKIRVEHTKVEEPRVFPCNTLISNNSVKLACIFNMNSIIFMVTYNGV